MSPSTQAPPRICVHVCSGPFGRDWHTENLVQLVRRESLWLCFRGRTRPRRRARDHRQTHRQSDTIWCRALLGGATLRRQSSTGETLPPVGSFDGAQQVEVSHGHSCNSKFGRRHHVWRLRRGRTADVLFFHHQEATRPVRFDPALTPAAWNTRADFPCAHRHYKNTQN